MCFAVHSREAARKCTMMFCAACPPRLRCLADHPKPLTMPSQTVLALLPEAEQHHSRLVLVVGPSGAGKTRLLAAVAAELGDEVVNVGRDLAERLLAVEPRFRPVEVSRQLDDILPAEGPALLDNTELLFEPSLAQDPLVLLERLARNRLVIAAWNGRIEDGHLTYAPTRHPAARRYPAAGLLVVPLSS